MKYNGSPLLDAKINGDALWPTIQGNLFNRMTAMSTTLTAAHFDTIRFSQPIKYRAYPISSVTAGTLKGEYLADVLDQKNPLVRGFEIENSEALRLRQYPGDNTGHGGLHTLLSADTSWETYVALAGSTPHVIYVIDVTSRNWMRLQPGVRGRGSVGGSFINFFLRSDALVNALPSSFSTRAALNTWLGGIMTDTVGREMIVAISTNTTFTPAF